MDVPVAITGMGIVSSLGTGVAKFQYALKSGINKFRRLDIPPLDFTIICASLNDEFSFEHALDAFNLDNTLTRSKIIKISRATPFPIKPTIIAALEANESAQLANFPARNRIGLVIAAQNTTTHYQYQQSEKFNTNPNYLNPAYALHFMDSDHIGILSSILTIKGESFTVGGASATGNVGLLRGFDLIHQNSVDICLVAGITADLSPLELQAFYNTGALGGKNFADEPGKASRPFDKKHEGFVYGQASAAMILESVASAKKRSVPILGYLLGGKIVLDANAQPNTNVDGEAQAMQEAIAAANIKVSDIDYINAHGSSSVLGDEVEVKALKQLLGSHRPKINSTKSITGHCLWSAGIVEAIATVLQMNNEFVHPNLNLDDAIDSSLNFCKKVSEPYQIKYAISNSYGFGGINSTIVLGHN